MPEFKYTKQRLINFCELNDIKLSNKDYYKTENLGRDYQINFICINCNKEGNRCYKNFINGLGALCFECTNKEKNNKRIKASLEIYGVEHPSQNEQIKKKKEETSIKNYGVPYASQNEEHKEKIKNTCLEKYGFPCALQNEGVKNKIRSTNTIRYGVENPSQNEQIKKKKEETSIKNYGVPYALQNEEEKNRRIQKLKDEFGIENQFQLQTIKDKSKQTCLEKYGSEYYTQTEEYKKRAKQTCLEKYGCETPLQNEEVKQKICSTNIKRYGVPYVSQNTTIMEKQSKNAYKLKEYKLPSGNIIKIQGYENYALDELLRDGILEEDIINGCSNVPEIWYVDELGIKHKHYVDIFIKSENKCIEIKSTWTAEKKKDCIFLKQQSGKELGYNYEIWVYNGKGEKVECYK